MSDTRYEYQSEFAKKYYGQGLEAGREALVRSLTRIIEARGLALSPAQRERIESCQELETLERWLERAIGISSTAELFEG